MAENAAMDRPDFEEKVEKKTESTEISLDDDKEKRQSFHGATLELNDGENEQVKTTDHIRKNVI